MVRRLPHRQGAGRGVLTEALPCSGIGPRRRREEGPFLPGSGALGPQVEALLSSGRVGSIHVHRFIGTYARTACYIFDIKKGNHTQVVSYTCFLVCKGIF